MYSTSPPLLVAVDLASVTTLEPAGLRRCLDTVFTAADSRDGLRTVFGVLERVLVAHVTCDPFVAERKGTRDLLRWLSCRSIPILGTASFTPAVAQALAQRFGWSTFGMKVVPCEGLPWDTIERVAGERGFAPEHVAYLTDDRWELAHAAEHGCRMTFDLSTASVPNVMQELKARFLEVAS